MHTHTHTHQHTYTLTYTCAQTGTHTHTHTHTYNYINKDPHFFRSKVVEAKSSLGIIFCFFWSIVKKIRNYRRGHWRNPHLVGKWSHSSALPFPQHAPTNPIPFPSQIPAFPSTSPDEHHPNPEPFFQSSLFQFPRFPQHMHLCET